MMQNKLHDDLLMGYAAGAVDGAVGLLVATQVSINDDARAKLGAFEAIGGAVLEQTTAVCVDESSFEATMSRIMSGAECETARDQSPANTVFPKPLYDHIGGDLEDVKWRSIGLGVKQAVLSKGQGVTARLLHIPAGQAMPDHGHNGMELTLVLQGAYLAEGQRFARGDVEIATPDDEHMPVADIGDDCICLVVTDAPLRFNGLLPRLAQKFLGI